MRRVLFPMLAVVLATGPGVVGCQTGSPHCLPPALTISVGRHSFSEASCAGVYDATYGPVTVKVGETIRAEIPSEHDVKTAPLPVSSDPGVVGLEWSSPDRRHATFRALASGRAVLDVWTYYCRYTASPAPTPVGGRIDPPTVPIHPCHVLIVDVRPGA